MGDNVNTGDLEWQDSGVSAGHNKAYYQAMHAFLKSVSHSRIALRISWSNQAERNYLPSKRL